MINTKFNWRLILFGILFYGGLIYLSLQYSKKIKVDLPEEINQADIGDTLIVISKDNNKISLGFKTK